MATVKETPAVGAWLKSIRVAANLSQSDLYKLIGIEGSRISAIENGRGSAPSLMTIQKWADACNAELPFRLIDDKGRCLWSSLENTAA
jgi:transcriptional regulator with XRE-family HTH domain